MTARAIFLRQALRGSIVLTTSVNATVSKKGSLAYDASKAAANHLTRGLAVELAPLVRARLAMPELPLARMLEGGTWAAGRALAQALRGGEPPLSIRSDGTVF